MELLKLVLIGRFRVQIPPNLPVCHGSGPMDAPRGIVVAGLDPWTLCHASTSTYPVVNSPSYKTKKYKKTVIQTVIRKYTNLRVILRSHMNKHY